MPPSRQFLVTGADGFLGRHFLTEIARRGHGARAMVRAQPSAALPGDPEVVIADLTAPDSLPPALAGITDIVHLAARVHQMRDTQDDPLAAFRRVNVDGTRHLVEAGVAAGTRRFLLMSSVKAMGEETTGRFDEESPCRPTTPYGTSKLESERILFQLALRHGLHATVLRLPMVYRPGNKGNVLRLLAAAAAGRRLPFGRLRNARSMVYVDNVTAAAMAALATERSAGQVYLVSDSRPYSTRELYEVICQAMNREPKLLGVPPFLLMLLARLGGLVELVLRRPMPINPGVMRRLTGDLQFSSEKLQRQLGVEPVVDLEEGIRRTVAWYLQRTNRPPASE